MVFFLLFSAISLGLHFRWSIFAQLFWSFFSFSKIRKKNNSKDKLVMLHIQMYTKNQFVWWVLEIFPRVEYFSFSLSLSHSLTLSLFLSLSQSLSLSFTLCFSMLLSLCLSLYCVFLSNYSLYFSISIYLTIFLSVCLELFRWPSPLCRWIAFFNNRDYIFGRSFIYHFSFLSTNDLSRIVRHNSLLFLSIWWQKEFEDDSITYCMCRRDWFIRGSLDIFFRPPWQKL